MSRSYTLYADKLILLIYVYALGRQFSAQQLTIILVYTFFKYVVGTIKLEFINKCSLLHQYLKKEKSS